MRNISCVLLFPDPCNPDKTSRGNGVFEIKQNDLNEVYKSAELTDICGIGARINERLNKIGISNLIELRQASLSFLIAEFGYAEAEFLKNVSLGIDNNSVRSYRNPVDVKSVSRNYCLPKNEYDLRIVRQNIFELCEEIGIKLRRLNKKARTIGISLKGNFNVHGRKTYSIYFDTGKEIFDVCISLSSSHLSSGSSKYVRQISVWVSGLQDATNTPLSLFDSSRLDSLQKTIDKINERFGDHTIRNGFLLHADKLTTVPNGYMADKYERIKLSNDLGD